MSGTLHLPSRKSWKPRGGRGPPRLPSRRSSLILRPGSPRTTLRLAARGPPPPRGPPRRRGPPLPLAWPALGWRWAPLRARFPWRRSRPLLWSGLRGISLRRRPASILTLRCGHGTRTRVLRRWVNKAHRAPAQWHPLWRRRWPRRPWNERGRLDRRVPQRRTRCGGGSANGPSSWRCSPQPSRRWLPARSGPSSSPGRPPRSRGPGPERHRSSQPLRRPLRRQTGTMPEPV